MFNKNGERHFIFGHDFMNKKILFNNLKIKNAERLFLKITWETGISPILPSECRSIGSETSNLTPIQNQ